MRSRAVESVVGFVLVFSLVASSVGVVYVFGFDGLQETRDAEQLSNVESAFDVLEDNVEDIQQEDAPHRATEFKLYRATLSTGDPVEFTVTVQNWNDPGPDGDGDPSTAEPLQTNIDAVPVVYTPEGGSVDRSIRYVNGAILRSDRGETTVLDPTPLVLRERGGERTAVFPLVETRDEGTTAVSGSTTVLVRADSVISESLAAATDPATDTTDGTGDVYEVVLTIETGPDRATAWAGHLNERFDAAYGVEPCTTSGGTVTCGPFETDRLFVSATRVDVAIEG